MTTDAMHASVTFLTYVQLSDAMAVSAAEQETRFAAFLAAADAVIANYSDEGKAEMEGAWAAYQEQAAMTRALAGEITVRVKRRDYA